MKKKRFSFLGFPFNVYEELSWLPRLTPSFLEGIGYQWRKYFGFDFYKNLEDIAEKAMFNHKSEKINVVGHSMGSLEAIAYTLNKPEKVENCVTIGAPWKGSNLAHLGIMFLSLGILPTTFMQIVPSSDYLKKLRSKFKETLPKLEKYNVKVTNIWSPLDEFIPGDNSLEDIVGRDSSAIEEHKLYVGHCQLFYCDYTFKLLSKMIRKSKNPTLLVHGLTINEHFFDNFMENLDKDLKKKVYTFSYDYAKALKV